MKTTINNICLRGIVGKEPRVRLFENGNRKASLILAIHETHQNKVGRNIETTQWQKVTAWGHTADQVMQQVHKGSKISLEGRMRRYSMTINEVKSKTVHEIILDQFEIILEMPQRQVIRA